MELSVRTPQNLVSEALRGHIEKRFRDALKRLGQSIRRVEVRVNDANGPRGGVDKECSALIACEGTQPLSFRALDDDAYRAIDRLAARVKHSLFKKRKELRSRKRRGRLSSPATVGG